MVISLCLSVETINLVTVKNQVMLKGSICTILLLTCLLNTGLAINLHADDGSMWIGTYAKGIFIVDPVTKTFSHYKNIVGSEQVNWLSLDSDGDLCLEDQTNGNLIIKD
jgi:ligand-binding sensor domain-containing protein